MLLLNKINALLALAGLGRAAAIEPTLASRQTTTDCVAGVHIIVARGTTETTPEGQMGDVANLIMSQIPCSDSVGVAYPATATNPPYLVSENEGTTNVTAYIEDYVASCPDTRIVLLGYSQGAQATMDALCGTSEKDFTPTAPLPAQYGAHISAIVVYGDPSHVYPQRYDVGTSRHSGAYPRQNTQPCQVYASRLQSYCDYNDKYCDNGTSIAVHQSYFSKYNQQAADFVVARASQQ